MYKVVYCKNNKSNMMNKKEKLVNYLRENGKTNSWVELYNMFPFKNKELTNKQKSDTVRKLYNRKVKQPNRFGDNGAYVENKMPKILVFDIETAPMKAYVWGLWQQNVPATNGALRNSWFMLTWSAKWLYNDGIMSDRLTPDEVRNEDDSRLSKQMWNLFNEADIIIAHNAVKFDVKRLNTRFLLNGINPPSPYLVIDTLVHAKKQFAFASNKLDYIAQKLGVGKKISTSMDLWIGCLDGKEEYLKQMETYNIQDVKVLEDVYLVLRPFMRSHPNLNIIVASEKTSCPTCLSTDLNWNGTYYTSANAYDAFSCKCCGSTGRSRRGKVTSEMRKSLTLPTAR